MKTYEDYFSTNSCGDNCVTISKSEFKQIQLDAYAQGMTDAADVVSSYHHNVTTPQVRALFAKTILSARDNKKEI